MPSCPSGSHFRDTSTNHSRNSTDPNQSTSFTISKEKEYKSHIIVWIVSKKEFDKIQHPFRILKKKTQ